MSTPGVWPVQTIRSASFTCGFCGNLVASGAGFRAEPHSSGQKPEHIHICPHCNKPTYIDWVGNRTPGAVFGSGVKDITNAEVATMYEEARKVCAVSAYTAAAMCCRKILMNVAVSKGAREGETFVFYVEYLADNNYVPPDARPWVDHIRTMGNTATHKIVLTSKEDAEELLQFTEMLLKVTFEFPAAVLRRLPARTQP